MIVRMSVLLMLAAGSFGTMASAQKTACELHGVNVGLLNVSKIAGGTIYIDVLEKGDIACITRQEKFLRKYWGYVAYKIEKNEKRSDVDGWAMMSHLTKLSATKAAEIESKTSLTRAAPPEPITGECKRFLPSAQVTVAVPCESAVGERTASAAPSPKAPVSPSVNPTHAQTPANTEDVLHFTQPVPFGPYPVNGRSLKELAESIPLFPPLEGIPEEMWKKSCATCHKWNQARLCEQGKTYAKSARQVLRHQHPFGGTYKIALMKWARSGCN